MGTVTVGLVLDWTGSKLCSLEESLLTEAEHGQCLLISPKSQWQCADCVHTCSLSAQGLPQLSAWDTRAGQQHCNTKLSIALASLVLTHPHMRKASHVRTCHFLTWIVCPSMSTRWAALWKVYNSKYSYFHLGAVSEEKFKHDLRELPHFAVLQWQLCSLSFSQKQAAMRWFGLETLIIHLLPHLTVIWCSQPYNP